MAKQKLSAQALRDKRARDLAEAKSPRRTRMRAENQKKRRDAEKDGKDVDGKDYDHNSKRFVSVKTNRGGHGRGTKVYNTKRNG
jgi:hypothetical protein